MAANLPPSDSSPSVPLHSVDECPICGCGLCGIRICGLGTERPHGLVVCDECEAIWTEPDTSVANLWRDPEDPRCPICQEPLWGAQSRWARREDLELLGWQHAFDPELNAEAEL
jgi:hypothetical protein